MTFSIPEKGGTYLDEVGDDDDEDGDEAGAGGADTQEQHGHEQEDVHQKGAREPAQRHTAKHRRRAQRQHGRQSLRSSEEGEGRELGERKTERGETRAHNVLQPFQECKSSGSRTFLKSSLEPPDSSSEGLMPVACMKDPAEKRRNMGVAVLFQKKGTRGESMSRSWACDLFVIGTTHVI
jgi:hypothetical protein